MAAYSEDWGAFACLLVPLVFWGWWIWARLGNDKRWFVAPMPIISSSSYFALPTAMLGILFVAIDIIIGVNNPDSIPVFSFIAFGLWGVSYIIVILEPNWMAPAWYRWLKKEHGDIMPHLLHDAERLGREA